MEQRSGSINIRSYETKGILLIGWTRAALPFWIKYFLGQSRLDRREEVKKEDGVQYFFFRKKVENNRFRFLDLKVVFILFFVRRWNCVNEW